jgi:hypothetical protein
MRTLTKSEQSEMYICMLLGSLISADNDKYSEDIKQEIIRRIDNSPKDYVYILEPLGEDAEKYIKFIKEVCIQEQER